VGGLHVQSQSLLRAMTIAIPRFDRKRLSILASTLSILLSSLILVLSWDCPALAQNDTASRIQTKISQVGANAIKLRESGADVSSIQAAMQQVDKLLRSGKVSDAEQILDSILTNRETLTTGMARTAAAPAPAGGHTCDPQQPMTVSGSVTLYADCTIGGDLTVTGSAALHFDYSGRNGGRLVVNGNIIVQDHATLLIQGRSDRRAVFVVHNEFSQQHSMTSTDDSTIKLDHVEFHTQKSVDRNKGSVYMSYEARGRSSLEVTDSTLVVEEAWLLANVNDSAKVALTDVQGVPTEIYVHDSSVVRIIGNRTKTGVWLDAGGTKGSLKLPDTNGPFSWQIGAGTGLDVGWSLKVEDAQPGIGIEVKPASQLTIIGNGTRAPVTGELKVAYYVVNSRELLDGLKAGMQNRKINDRLTLENVQLGPIAWQIYAGDSADLTIKSSTINEIGIFGQNAKVRVERSVLQLAVLAALGPGSSLEILDSEIWNQAVEVANKGRVSITDSKVYGTLFHARDSGSSISIKGGSFYENPAHCTQGKMVNIATGQPKCNPFSTQGLPRSAGTGKIACVGTENCKWNH
jgi:hypothetical protein